MQKWHRYLGIVNIVLTGLLMSVMLWSVQATYQQFSNLYANNLSNKQIFSTFLFTGIIVTGIGLLIKYNVYRVIFGLYLVEIPGKILYFYQLFVALLVSLITIVIPLEWATTLFGQIMIAAMSFCSTGVLLFLLGRYVWQFPTEVDSKKRFLTASGLIILINLVLFIVGMCIKWIQH